MTPFLKMHSPGMEFAASDARNEAFAPDPPYSQAPTRGRNGEGRDQEIVIEPRCSEAVAV